MKTIPSKRLVLIGIVVAAFAVGVVVGAVSHSRVVAFEEVTLSKEQIAKIDLFRHTPKATGEQPIFTLDDSWMILNQNEDLEILEIVFERRFTAGENRFDEGPRYFTAKMNAKPFSYSAWITVPMGAYHRDNHTITIWKARGKRVR